MRVEINKKLLFERLMIFFAALVQVVGFIISITIEDFSCSYIPYSNIVIPIINILCASICFFLVAFPKFRFLQSIVSFIQGIAMTLNNIMFLGVFLYIFGLVLFFCYGYIKKIINALLLLLPLLLSIFLFLPESKSKFFMAFVYLLFVIFSFFHLYNTVKDNLFSLFPFLANKISNVNLPVPGSKLVLKNYDFSERQIEIIKIFKDGETNYKNLSNTFITSESTIKREMSEICKKLGVENSSMLKILLNQYTALEI